MLFLPILLCLGLAEGSRLHLGRQSFAGQLANHFDAADKRRWAQPYSVGCVERKPGTSALSYIELHLRGEEGPSAAALRRRRSVSATIEELSGVVPSKRNSSIVCAGRSVAFTLTHRFYVSAQPTGDLSLSSLRLHSSRQALEDAARFIRLVIRGRHGLSQPIIVVGGSYPGALSVWLRLKYPNLVQGSLGYSPVIFAEANFAAFENVTLGVLRKEQPACLAALKSVYGQIRGKPKSWLFPKLGLCSEGGTSVAALVDGIWSRLTYRINEEMVQYWQEQKLRDFCSAFTADPYKAIREEFIDPHASGNGGCKSTAGLLKEPFPTGDWEEFSCNIGPCKIQRAWWWQKCSEFGWFKTTNAASDTFFFYSMDEFFATCQQIYLLSREDVIDNVARTNDHFGGRNISAGSNILIINGEYDPWHAVSLPSNIDYGAQASNPCGVTSVQVPTAGHCPSTEKTEKLAGQLIAEWLKK